MSAAKPLAVVEIRVHVGDDIVLEHQEFAEYHGPWSVLTPFEKACEAFQLRLDAGALAELIDTPHVTSVTHTHDGVRLGYQASVRTPTSEKWGGIG